MTQRVRLNDTEITAALASLHGWSVIGGKLHKDVQFRDFTQAFGFMASVALIAESLNHHPEWSNVYNRVAIDLTTHDARGITALDITFAERVERLLSP